MLGHLMFMEINFEFTQVTARLLPVLRFRYAR